ncbi:MAG TPA: hypothetical protein VNT76_12270, partial [Candidatus Binatus sp.]|nr:hypothetical protein [Candidatus Binatus sp.]
TMANRDLKIRTKIYALSVIRLFTELPKRTETQIMGRQLLRSGTCVGDSGLTLISTFREFSKRGSFSGSLIA